MTPRNVGFPWYDIGTASAGWDALWRSLRPHLAELGFGPLDVTLDRRTASMQWRDPALLLSQCCGLDVPRLPHVQPVAAPVFAALDCEPGFYYSLIIAGDEPHTSFRVAINDRYSRSGHTALREWLAEHSLRPSSEIWTGSHAASLRAVRDGSADIAAIDAISWEALDGAGVRIVGRTRTVPAPPFIAPLALDAVGLRRTLGAAIADCGADNPIGLCGVVAVDAPTYCDFVNDLEWVKAHLE